MAGEVAIYGCRWPAGTSRLTIELQCFRVGGTLHLRGGMSKADHFRNACRILWPESKRGGVAAKYVHHPWSDWMVEEACKNNWLALAGCASIGKSEFLAVWGIINWLCAPNKTAVLITTTTLRDAKKRVWGAVQRYWHAIERFLPGKMVEAPSPSIRYVDVITKKVYDQYGVFLIPAEKQKAKDITGKMLGMKADRVILLADELSELSEALLDTAYGNLSTNPYFQMIGAANPNSRYDPFGLFAKPKAGWGSIAVSDKRWETDRGVCLHFDSLESPNWVEGENVWPILRVEKIQEALDSMDQNSPLFWRQFRGFWCPEGYTQCVFSEADILKFKGEDPAVWEGEPTLVAGMDPSFSNGGDRAVAYFGKVGMIAGRVKAVEFGEHVVLEEDVTKKDEPRSYQIARKFKEACEKRGVEPQNVAVDATGGGAPFADILAAEWSPRFLRVQFGGRASDIPVGLLDPRPACEKYANRVTELWYSGYELLRAGQVRGLSADIIREMTARQYSTVKGADMRVLLESKEDMRKRTSGLSPDIADAGFIMVALARERLGMAVSGPARKGLSVDWKKMRVKFDAASRSGRYLHS